MYFANLTRGIRVHIDDVSIDEKCFCPICEAPLVKKIGVVRRAHFAHRNGYVCYDPWHEELSRWNYEWQNRFPKECREAIISYGGQVHKADILIENTVVLFRSKFLSAREFEEQNIFYTAAGYKVIWVFNLIKQMEDERLVLQERFDLRNQCKWKWKWHSATFNDFDFKDNQIEVFFQIEEIYEENLYRPAMIKVCGGFWDGDGGFYASEAISAARFLGKPEESADLEEGSTSSGENDSKSEKGKRLDVLWRETTGIRVGRFINVKLGYEVFLVRNPLEMAGKYHGKVYGRIRKPGYKYFTKETREIYYWDSPEWRLVWWSAE